MTLDEVIYLAENGDFQAILTLGNFYFENEKHAEAAKWFATAADSDEATIYAATMAILSNAIKAHAEQGIGSLSNAFHTWQKVRSWCFNLLNTPTTPTENKKIALENLATSAYGMAYCLYGNNQINDALNVLETAIKQDSATDEINILYGVCLVDSNSQLYCTDPNLAFSKAYPYLKVIETTSADIDDTIAALALYSLGIIYRMSDIPDTPINIEASYECIKRISSISESMGELANQDLKNYKRNAYGKLVYCGN